MRRPPTRVLSTLAAVALAAACAAETDDATRPTNVVLVSIDTLRADHLGAYGNVRDTSPFLDRLAAGGVVFENTLSSSSWTLPAHMSLMTSLDAPVHGVTRDDVSLARGVTTLAAAMRRGGYRTAAFVSWIYVGGAYGFARGFDDFTQLASPHWREAPFSNEGYRAEQVSARAVEWLRRDAGEEPFFLFLHYFDPHADYDPPEPYASMFDPDYEGEATGAYAWIRPYIKRLRQEPSPDRPVRPIRPRDLEHVVALYDGEIRYVDAQLERVHHELDRLGLLDRTLFVVTADHGEEFGDHGSLEGHGWTLYREVLHVPLLLRFPGGADAGHVARVPGPVQLIDVAPTVLDAVGLPIPAGFRGRSLVPDLEGRERVPADGRLIFAHTDRSTRKRSVQDARHKLIWSPPQESTTAFVADPEGYELFDLIEDPRERNDLAAERPRVVEALRGALERWLEQSAGAARAPGPPVELDADQLEMLRRLGYAE